MSEPVIPIPQPIEIPAKTYSQQYITKTVINALPEKSWDVLIESKAYDGDKSLLNESFMIQLKDIKGCAALAPKLAVAMEKMVEALGLISIAARATNTKIITPQNITQVLAAIEGGE